MGGVHSCPRSPNKDNFVHNVILHLTGEVAFFTVPSLHRDFCVTTTATPSSGSSTQQVHGEAWRPPTHLWMNTDSRYVLSAGSVPNTGPGASHQRRTGHAPCLRAPRAWTGCVKTVHISSQLHTLQCLTGGPNPATAEYLHYRNWQSLPRVVWMFRFLGVCFVVGHQHPVASNVT